MCLVYVSIIDSHSFFCCFFLSELKLFMKHISTMPFLGHHVTMIIVYMLSLSYQTCSSEHETYARMYLNSQQGQRFSDPVRVPGLPDVLERAYVLQKIKGML